MAIDDHRDAREVLLERDEEPLGDGDPERDLEPVLAQPALAGRRLGGLRGRGRRRLGCLPFRHRSTVPRWKCDPCLTPVGECDGRLPRVGLALEEAVERRPCAADIGPHGASRSSSAASGE